MTKTNRTGMVVAAVVAAVLMALTLVSTATGHFYGLTVVLAFLMPVLAFVELDLLCKLLPSRRVRAMWSCCLRPAPAWIWLPA